MGASRYYNLLNFFKLKKEFKREQITHLIIEHPYLGWLALLLRYSLRLKLVVRSHNIEAIRFKTIGKWWWRILWHYEKFVHRRADMSFFITEEDRDYAVRVFGIDSKKSIVITYGTEKGHALSADEKAVAKKDICDRHGIPFSNHLLLYNGTMDYAPNKRGLDIILEEINPILLQQKDFNYTILICGNRLSPDYNELRPYNDRNILYAGFVDNIDTYFAAADIFINPVYDGGGIKTKLVEALAAGCSAVSFTNGAIGIPLAVTGQKLQIVPDGDSAGFAQLILASVPYLQEPVPQAFFDHFNWGSISDKAAACLGIGAGH